MWKNMYWYVKVALVALIVAVTVGLALLLRPLFSAKPPVVETEVVGANGPQNGANTGTVGTGGNVGAGGVSQTGGTVGVGGVGGGPHRAVPAIPKVPQEVMRRVLTQLDVAKRQYAAGQPLEARATIDAILKDPGMVLYSDAWEAVVPLLNEVNGVFLFTDAPAPEKVAHTVVSGDSLWKIAKTYKTTMEMIQRHNNMDPTNPLIMPGQVLHVMRATFSIDVSKTYYTLILRDGERVVRVYKVGVGRQDRTPEARFTMVDKVADPPWTYQGRVIPFGDKENVLGTRWMKLTAVDEKDKHLVGYGIHGTWEPDSIGTAASNGCIRMKNDQVEELYDILTVGIPVVIHD